MGAKWQGEEQCILHPNSDYKPQSSAKCKSLACAQCTVWMGQNFTQMA